MHRRSGYRIALACAAVLAIAGCKNSAQVFQDNNEGGWFSKPLDLFAKPSWASSTTDAKNYSLGPSGPVATEDLVGADGRCSPNATALVEAPSQSVAAAAADRPIGSVAGNLPGAPRPAPVGATPKDAGQPAIGPAVMGGIALGMSECDVVRRAGLPGNVNISAGDKGERLVVLSYLTGPWPGIYTFDSGRLRIVDHAPEPPAQPRPVKTKKQMKPKTVTAAPVERAYVQ